MAMTLTEKILARAAGLKSVYPGMILNAAVDRLMINDYVGPMVRHEFAKLDGSVVIPEKVLVCVDHSMPPATVAQANNLTAMRAFCRAHGIRRFAEIGRHGIGHQLMVEDFVMPGEVAVGTDSHATMYGALGALSCGITATDAVIALCTGQLWFQVPPTMRISLSGSMPRFVTGKDLALYILRAVDGRELNYCALEIGGSALRELSMADRFSLANMLAETDAKNVILESDDVTEAYLGRRMETAQCPDAAAAYMDTLEISLDALEPLVACPDSVANVVPVREVAGVRVDQVFIGSCTNGRLEDLAQAAAILRGKKVADSVRLIVVPASQAVYAEAIRQGYVSDLLAAGAAVLTPCCASCAGTGVAVVGDGEVCVSTTNRNFKGRMGSMQSRVYLASAYTAAAAALNGAISPIV